MESIAARIQRDGPINELDAVGWAIRLAKRIEALHALGVAHGSISPECMLTSAVDRTARGMIADLRHTQERVGYQSPERVAGGSISPVDDVWAIASTLYEMLTGASPFGSGSDADVRQRIAAGSPAPLAVYDVGDDDLQHILDGAFDRNAAARTTSVMALRRALEDWHPDRGVRVLGPLEDEDATNDDDEDVRTVARVPVYEEIEAMVAAQHPAPAGAYAPAYQAPPAAAPAYQAPPAAAPAYQAPPAAAPAYQAPPASAPAYQAPPVAAQPAYPPYGAAPEGMASVDSTLDDDEDEAATRMREVQLQPVYDGGVLYNAPAPARQSALQQRLPAGHAGVPQRVALTAPGLDRTQPDRSGYRQPQQAQAPMQLDATQAFEPGAGSPPWDQEPTYDDDEMRTVERGSEEMMPAAPSAQRHAPYGGAPPAGAAGPSRTYPGAPPMGAGASPMGASPMGAGAQPMGRGAQPMGGGAPAQQGLGGPPPGFPQPPSQRGIAAPLGAFPAPYAESGAPGARPGPTQVYGDPTASGGLLGPSPIATFGQAPRGPATGARPAFSQGAPVGPASPSPFAAPGGDLLIPPPMPDRSGQRGMIVALVVVALLLAGVIAFAWQGGLFGAAPSRAPGAVAVRLA